MPREGVPPALHGVPSDVHSAAVIMPHLRSDVRACRRIVEAWPALYPFALLASSFKQKRKPVPGRLPLSSRRWAVPTPMGLRFSRRDMMGNVHRCTPPARALAPLVERTPRRDVRFFARKLFRLPCSRCYSMPTGATRWNRRIRPLRCPDGHLRWSSEVYQPALAHGSQRRSQGFKSPHLHHSSEPRQRISVGARAVLGPRLVHVGSWTAAPWPGAP